MASEEMYLQYHGLLLPKETHSPESLKFVRKYTFSDSDVLAVTYPKSGESCCCMLSGRGCRNLDTSLAAAVSTQYERCRIHYKKLLYSSLGVSKKTWVIISHFILYIMIHFSLFDWDGKLCGCECVSCVQVAKNSSSLNGFIYILPNHHHDLRLSAIMFLNCSVSAASQIVKLHQLNPSFSQSEWKCSPCRTQLN